MISADEYFVWDITGALYKGRCELHYLRQLSNFPGFAIVDPDYFQKSKWLSHLLRCPGITMKPNDDSCGDLAPDFCRVLDDVRQHLSVCDLPPESFGRVAMRYAEWLPLPLDGAWSSFFYDAHCSPSIIQNWDGS